MPRAPLRRRQQTRNGPVPRTNSYKKIPSSSPAKAELTKKLANKPIGPRPTDSDDSDRLVVKGNGRRGRYAPTHEIYASGAVGKGDKPGNHPTRAQRRKSLTDATKEILTNGQQEARKGKAPTAAKDDKARPQSKEDLPHVNGVIKKPTVAKKDTAPPSSVVSSAVKAPGSVLRPVQPTPTRENSILGTLKPRRRQPSILQTLDQDSSSFDLGDEEEFLPDDESTPLDQSEPRHLASTPIRPPPLLSSSSRKRKFGASDPFNPAGTEDIRKLVSSPISNGQGLQPTPDLSLPAVPVSSLLKSGRKNRESLRDEDDVMALPQSSSSPAPSPAKNKTPIAATKRRGQNTRPVPTMTTKELLEAAMPTKRQRTVRERTRNRSHFDIPADSDPEEAHEEEDSNFLPSKNGQKTRRKEPVSKPSTARTKAPAKSKANSQAAGKKPKSSTSHFTTISATSAPILTPSTTSNRETKSPSQQLSTTNASFSTDRMVAKGTQKRYGGSRRGKGGTTMSGGEKENQGFQALSDESADEVGGGGSDTSDVGKTAPVSRGKWADIDAWDMDFEEVEVMIGSSSPTRR